MPSSTLAQLPAAGSIVPLATTLSNACKNTSVADPKQQQAMRTVLALQQDMAGDADARTQEGCLHKLWLVYQDEHAHLCAGSGRA